MTPFAALQSLCGLSNREAAEFLGTKESYVEKLRSGRKRAGREYLTRLADLWSEIKHPAADTEWPCLGAWRQNAAVMIADTISAGGYETVSDIFSPPDFPSRDP